MTDKQKLIKHKPEFEKRVARLSNTRTLYGTSGIGFAIIAIVVQEPILSTIMLGFSFINLLVAALAQYYINGFNKAIAIVEKWEKE